MNHNISNYPKYNSSSSIETSNHQSLNVAVKETKEIALENKVKELLAKNQEKVDQSEVEKQSDTKRTVTLIKKESTHTTASSAPTVPKNNTDQDSPVNSSYLPWDIQKIIGKYLDLPTFNALFATSAEYRKDPDFVQFLRNETLWNFAIKIALKSQYKKVDTIIRAQIRNGDIDRAKETLLLMDKTSYEFEDYLEKIIIADAQRGNISTAEKGIPLLKNYNKSQALTAISEAKARIDDKEGAKKGLSLAKDEAISIENKSLQIESLNKIALAEAQFVSVEKAKETFDFSKKMALAISKSRFSDQCESQCYAVHSIALAELQAGYVDDAKETLAVAKQLALQIKSNRTRTIADYLTKIALTLIQAGDKEEVKEIKKILLSINDRLAKCDALQKIAAVQINNDKEGAKENLLLARDILLPMTNDYTFKNDRLKKVAIMQAEACAVSSAKETASSIEGPEYKSLALKEIALVQLKSDNMGAKETLASASSVALQIEHLDIRFQTLIEIAQAKAKARDVPGVKTTIGSAYEAISEKKQLTALFDIIKIQAAIGNTQEVEKLFNAIREQTLEAKYSANFSLLDTLRQTAEVQIEIGDILQAKETLLSMKNQALLADDYHRKCPALEKIATMQAQIGDIQEAQKTLSDINKTGNTQHGINAVLNVLSILNKTK